MSVITVKQIQGNEGLRGNLCIASCESAMIHEIAPVTKFLTLSASVNKHAVNMVKKRTCGFSHVYTSLSIDSRD